MFILFNTIIIIMGNNLSRLEEGGEKSPRRAEGPSSMESPVAGGIDAKIGILKVELEGLLPLLEGSLSEFRKDIENGVFGEKGKERSLIEGTFDELEEVFDNFSAKVKGLERTLGQGLEGEISEVTFNTKMRLFSDQIYKLRGILEKLEQKIRRGDFGELESDSASSVRKLCEGLRGFIDELEGVRKSVMRDLG